MRFLSVGVGTTIAVWLMLAAGVGAQPAEPAKTAIATFAGGCFWCVEADFDKVEGVISTTSGYTGGHTVEPSYEEVSRGGTGHAESVEVVFDPAKVSYEKLLDVFWHNIDPLTKNRQFCDHGDQYRTAIFYHDETQHSLAEASKAKVQARFKSADRDRDHAGRPVLQGRGIPPGLSPEEPDPLQVLPFQLRAGCAARGALGQKGIGCGSV